MSYTRNATWLLALRSVTRHFLNNVAQLCLHKRSVKIMQLRGDCPACEYQWQATACMSCGWASPDGDWYLPEEHHL